MCWTNGYQLLVDCYELSVKKGCLAKRQPFLYHLGSSYAAAPPAVFPSRPLTASQLMFEKNASMYFGLSAGA